MINFGTSLNINNEWWTPFRYTRAADYVMRGIDLDPASCLQANQTVRASRYYTAEDDGLQMPWYGRVYCNPPFTASTSIPQPQFAWGSKLVREYQSGNVSEAILLIMAATKQRWFHKLWRMHNGPLCFCEKRIMFIRPNKGDRQDLRESTCFVYLGPNEDRFIEAFSQFGTIVRRVDVPAAKLITSELWTEVPTHE